MNNLDFVDRLWLAVAGLAAGVLACTLIHERLSLWWLERSARKGPKRYEPGEGPRGRSRHG